MGEDSAKKKKKKEGPAEARKRRKAIITSHRAGGVSSTVAPPNNNNNPPPTSEDTAVVDATTATITTEPSSVMEAAMAAALAEASTPLMEAAVLAAATAAVESTTTGDDVVTPSSGDVAADETATTTTITVPSENPDKAATEDAESKEAAAAVGETVPTIKIETPPPIDNEAKCDAGLPKPDEDLEATDNESDGEEQSSDAGKPRIETVVTTKQNAHGSKKKTQVCYEPSVPMPKDQLAAWRREARKVRNRESAAASRQRTRSRIAELEDEVTDWKEKYNTTMGRLQELLQQQNQQHHHQTQTGHVDGVNNTNGETGTLA